MLYKKRFLGVILILLLLLAGVRYFRQRANPYPGHKAFTDSLITVAYPKLYRAVYARQPERLKPFMEDKSMEIRKQAWRAFAATPVDSLGGFIQMAQKSNLRVAWFGISMHPLASAQLRDLEEYWQKHADSRAGVCLVLGQQGDKQSLDFLINHLDLASGSDYEYEFALAIGRLMNQFQLEKAGQERIIRRAFAVSNPDITPAYLYGWYRNSKQALSAQPKDSLYQHWKLYGLGKNTKVDQYIARILGKQEFYEIALYYNSEESFGRHTQLAVELAQSLQKITLNEDNILAAKILLTHPNPVVVQQTLSSLKGKIKRGETLYSYITNDILADTTTDIHIWLQALETVVCSNPKLAEKYSEDLKDTERHHPYLQEQVLNVLQWSKNTTGYLAYAHRVVDSGSAIRTMAVLNALYKYWASLDDLKEDSSYENETREIVFDALNQHDRGIAYMAQGLLKNKLLFGPDDFTRINKSLNGFHLPEDIEVFQAFGALYKEQFEMQAESVIRFWANKGYAPLNSSLKQSGWNVRVPEEDAQTTFRKPDWNRLWDLGPEPVWVLETEKGIIEVRMNTLAAPATISAIDSLTQAGAYNGIPFHRVVPNFVIQGGDVERKDGFGGPDFIIPTEASEREFDRGAAGIASAGADTEGSQYFFMHQWKPHLNGRYTLFGKVIQGMDVVDKMGVGDKVKQVYWITQ